MADTLTNILEGHAATTVVPQVAVLLAQLGRFTVALCLSSLEPTANHHRQPDQHEQHPPAFHRRTSSTVSESSPLRVLSQQEVKSIG
jgi:hypothetical protein